jgi:hypothetical protein
LPHHLQKLLLVNYSFFHEQPGEGFLLHNLVHQEFFKGNDLFGIEGGCHTTFPILFSKFISLKIFYHCLITFSLIQTQFRFEQFKSICTKFRSPCFNITIVET